MRQRAKKRTSFWMLLCFTAFTAMHLVILAAQWGNTMMTGQEHTTSIGSSIFPPEKYLVDPAPMLNWIMST
eukprot:gene23019-27851_t